MSPDTAFDAPPPPRCLAVANQKGGVGKTTTAINLGTALAAVDKRVLLIDLDPQANATTGFGFRPDTLGGTVYDVLTERTTLDRILLETLVPNLWIAPSSVDLSAAELELVSVMAREFRLREALKELQRSFDVILIDCPPALGLLTINALVAADGLLVPLQAEYYALEGLSHLLRTHERVRRGLNPDLELIGVVLTMFDRRNRLCELVASDVREHLGQRVFETMIPRNVRVSEAPSHGKPVLIYDMRCAGSKAYMRLAKELIRRLRERVPA